ncbi:hypothetical protein BKA70DRAFT_1401250 [Coprinopsis sp. MPI-PUGE-AT-0042]|nr:hypothetical protein BKA70DRAFT_1401250 [Coprinopsis sp. MPI-PUGE-AT-0042]
MSEKPDICWNTLFPIAWQGEMRSVGINGSSVGTPGATAEQRLGNKGKWTSTPSVMPLDRRWWQALPVANTGKCGDVTQKVPFYRSYLQTIGDHFYTINKTEHHIALDEIGYTEEGVVGYLFAKPQKGTVALYRLSIIWSGVDHFYTTNGLEKDNVMTTHHGIYEGVAGYVYPDAACGGSPLFRLQHPGLHNHFYTMNRTEREECIRDGWKDEDVAGYMFHI